MNLSIMESFRLIIDIVMLSAGIGLAFVALSTPRRTATNYYFAIFAFVLSGFAITLFTRTFAGSLPGFSPEMSIRLLALFLVLLIGAFFSFVVYFLENKQTVIIWSMRGFWIIAIIASGASLSGSIFSSISPDAKQFDLNIWGIVLLAIAVIYSVIAVTIIFLSVKEEAKWLRVPAICVACGYFMTMILADLPLDIFLFTFGALWAASALVRKQIFQPMRVMNHELELKNADLEKTIEQLQLEKARVERLNTELVDSNRYKSEFLSTISHELRTPLNAVIGYSELLSSPVYGKLNSQQEDRLQRIYKNGKHLSQLIENILDISRLETGKIRLDIEPCDIYSLVDNVLERIEAVREEKGLELDQELQANLPSVMADRKRLEQILYCLVENAVKFTMKGKIYIRIMSLTVRNGRTNAIALPSPDWLSDGQWVLMQVSDTGVGITEEQMGRIFINFTQGDGSQTREFGGVGLGLALVKHLVELHHGDIWVESTPDVGSTFYVVIPVGS